MAAAPLFPYTAMATVQRRSVQSAVQGRPVQYELYSAAVTTVHDQLYTGTG